MSDQVRTARRFLGRPEDAYPGFVPPEVAEPGVAPRPGEKSRAGRWWLVQAVSGAALVVFLGVHMMAQHILAPGGLRDYAAVAEFLRQPFALFSEVGLVASVLVHVVAGIRAFVVEVVQAPRTVARITAVSMVVALAVFVYAIWLTFVIVTSA